MADNSTTTIANLAAAVPTSQVNNVTSAICTIADTTVAQDSGLVMSANHPSSTSWLASLGRSLLLIAKFIPGLLYWIVTFSTITLPTILFTLFSMSLTFTMNFTTLYVRIAPLKMQLAKSTSLLILLAFASLVSWLVRYRFLNMYTRLPLEPQRKEPQIDLFPDTQGDSKPGLANYLDEFLSAIKVFGYRESGLDFMFEDQS